MTVTIVADVLGAENNGTTVACMNLIRYLTECGDNVRVVCCDKDKKDKDNYYIVDTLNLGRIPNAIIEKNNVSIAKADKKTVDQSLDGTDVVHIMTPFVLGRCALFEAISKNIPVTAGFHCQAENITSHLQLMNDNRLNHAIYMNFYKSFYKYVDSIHYPTQFIREVFEKETKCKTKAYVISNGVNDIFRQKETDKPEELKGKFIILFIGRFSREKSHSVLIRAVAKSRHRDSIQLIFAGSGPREFEIRQLAKKSGINQPVMKFFTRTELVDVINYSDLYCHPAEIEIEAISCLEAITCGLVPVIANSPKCATKNFAIDEKSLFKVNNVSDLAEKIDFWIEHEDLRKQYSKKYIENSEAVRQKECMRQMRNMLSETIERRKMNEEKNYPIFRY
ncbi:MAG: glycosyltransferase [Clostridia bacterium]|nr:glycosyltransferase [Clostridia bacterium]